MSIYKKNKINLNFIKQNKKIISIIAIIIILLIAIFFISKNIDLTKEQNPIKAEFQKNPISIKDNNSVLLKINVKNPKTNDLNNSKIKINNIDSNFFIFCNKKDPINQIEIPKIAKNNNRELFCDIKINKEIMLGTYSFEIEFITKDENFSKRVSLEIKE